MKVSGVLLPALACGVAAVDYTTILADISSISNLTDTLSRDLAAVQPSFTGVGSQLQVQVDSLAIHKKVQSSLTDTQASTPYGATGSRAVLNALTNLSGKVNTTLQQTITAKPLFGQLTQVVLASVEALKDDTITFSLAQATKFDPDVSISALSLLTQVSNAYDNVIRAYGGNPNNAATAGLPTVYSFPPS